MEWTDSELIRRAQRGDTEAFGQLAQRHGDYLYRLAVSLLGDPTGAQDVLQEALLGAYQAVGSFAGRAAVRTWLIRILVRQVARHRRREKIRRTWSLAGPEVGPGPTATGGTARSDAKLDVQAALQTLTPEFREVLVLRELEGLAYEEIAAVLGVPRGTVESRLFRARAQFRERLGA